MTLDPDETRRQASAWDARGEVLLAVTRGASVESVHRGVVAVADASGDYLGGAGDPEMPVHLRSAAKPFQALALVSSGAADELGVPDEELAVVCGSHSGEERHVRLVAGLLERLGLSVDDLVCGAHPPFDREARAALASAGLEPTALHCNCSGKHAGMLALARFFGAPTAGYESVAHPVQRHIAATIGRVLGIDQRTVFDGVDGCGVPVVRVTALQAATLFARLALGADQALARVRDAMIAHPALVAGAGRFDTRVMEGAGGGVLAKTGAEGVQALGLLAGPALGPVGCLIKVEDGGDRPVPVLTAAVLRSWRGETATAALAGHDAGEVRSVAGAVVGEMLVVPSAGDLRRRNPGRPAVGGPTPGPLLGVRLTMASRDDREVTRFLRANWPGADEELLGQAHDWRSEAVVVAARDGRRMVGACRGTLVGGVASLEELLVAAERRGLGVGSSLLSAFEAHARANGCHKVSLRTPRGSQAEAFYRGRGYRREGDLWAHHFRHDLRVMAKEL